MRESYLISIISPSKSPSAIQRLFADSLRRFRFLGQRPGVCLRLAAKAFFEFLSGCWAAATLPHTPREMLVARTWPAGTCQPNLLAFMLLQQLEAPGRQLAESSSTGNDREDAGLSDEDARQVQLAGLRMERVV